MTHRHTCSEGVSHVFDGLVLLLITTGVGRQDVCHVE